MLITISDRDRFVKSFLSPISKMSESACVSVHADRIQTVVNSPDSSLILYATREMPNKSVEQDSPLTLNIPNVNKFINLLSCVADDDIAVTYDQNKIVCSSGELKFQYHLLDDGILKIPSINIQKIKALEFDTSFFLTKDNLTSLMRASTFATDTDKLYVYTDGSNVIGELTDKQQMNVDSFRQPISMSYTGNSITSPLAINFELIRVISSLRINQECRITVHVNNSNSVLLFDIACDGNKLKYITSAYAET